LKTEFLVFASPPDQRDVVLARRGEYFVVTIRSELQTSVEKSHQPFF